MRAYKNWRNITRGHLQEKNEYQEERKLERGRINCKQEVIKMNRSRKEKKKRILNKWNINKFADRKKIPTQKKNNNNKKRKEKYKTKKREKKSPPG